MMDVLMKAGAEFNAVPYGTEALGVMRIEKATRRAMNLTVKPPRSTLGLEDLPSSKKTALAKRLSVQSSISQMLSALSGSNP